MCRYWLLDCKQPAQPGGRSQDYLKNVPFPAIYQPLFCNYEPGVFTLALHSFQVLQQRTCNWFDRRTEQESTLANLANGQLPKLQSYQHVYRLSIVLGALDSLALVGMASNSVEWIWPRMFEWLMRKGQSCNNLSCKTDQSS